MILTITSLIHHSNTTKLTYIIDKIGIIFVVLYGAYFFYNKCLNIQKPIEYFYALIIVITFLSTIFLYYYGFQCKHYCFSLDDNVAQFYHVLMHFVSSVGHHLIIHF
jgi:prepilin signal peptidase PulO-like enzyme (type II secretory pathway)